MSRYYGYVLITFNDGTTERVGGNEDGIYNDQLVISTRSPYGGGSKDVRHYPLSNIREWHWENDE